MTEVDLQQQPGVYSSLESDARKYLESDQGETEDEEVKRNCVLGQSGLLDSDFSESEDEEVDYDEDEEDNSNNSEAIDRDGGKDETMQEKEDGLVQFVTRVQLREEEGMIYRPTPIIPKLVTNPQESEENDSTDSEESVHSVNARGAPFCLTDSNDDLESGSSEEDADADGDIEEKESIDEGVDDESQLETHESSDEEEQDGEDAEDAAASSFVADAMVFSKAEVDDVQGESVSVSYALVGASGASVDEKWTWSKQKRVLSSNTLASLNREAGRDAEVPKRLRAFPAVGPSAMPDLSLGIAALDNIQPLPRQYLMRDYSPNPSTDDDEDKVLSEELEEKLRGDVGDNSPIPLLTPPQSPRREEEDTTIPVEWPSNLVVDSAMMNTVTDVRPLSPASLQTLEEEDEVRLKSHDAEPSSLMPLLRSIYVGNT